MRASVRMTRYLESWGAARPFAHLNHRESVSSGETPVPSGRRPKVGPSLPDCSASAPRVRGCGTDFGGPSLQSNCPLSLRFQTIPLRRHRTPDRYVHCPLLCQPWPAFLAKSCPSYPLRVCPLQSGCPAILCPGGQLGGVVAWNPNFTVTGCLWCPHVITGSVVGVREVCGWRGRGLRGPLSASGWAAGQLGLLLGARPLLALSGPQWDPPVPPPPYTRLWGLLQASGHPERGAVSRTLLPLGQLVMRFGFLIQEHVPQGAVGGRLIR